MNKLFIRVLFVVSANFSLPVWAFPSSPFIVEAGSAIFSLDGNVFNIQSTPDTILRWSDFSIGAGETVNFVQASSSSSVLNRILGGAPSIISGSMLSNGSLSLYSPEGFIFSDALVNVGDSFTVSTEGNINMTGGSILIVARSATIINGDHSDGDFILNTGDILNTDIVLTVPEPNSSLMLLAGLGLFGMNVRRRS